MALGAHLEALRFAAVVSAAAHRAGAHRRRPVCRRAGPGHALPGCSGVAHHADRDAGHEKRRRGFGVRRRPRRLAFVVRARRARRRTGLRDVSTVVPGLGLEQRLAGVFPRPARGRAGDESVGGRGRSPRPELADRARSRSPPRTERVPAADGVRVQKRLRVPRRVPVGRLRLRRSRRRLEHDSSARTSTSARELFAASVPRGARCRRARAFRSGGFRAHRRDASAGRRSGARRRLRRRSLRGRARRRGFGRGRRLELRAGARGERRERFRGGGGDGGQRCGRRLPPGQLAPRLEVHAAGRDSRKGRQGVQVRRTSGARGQGQGQERRGDGRGGGGGPGHDQAPFVLLRGEGDARETARGRPPRRGGRGGREAPPPREDAGRSNAKAPSPDGLRGDGRSRGGADGEETARRNGVRGGAKRRRSRRRGDASRYVRVPRRGFESASRRVVRPRDRRRATEVVTQRVVVRRRVVPTQRVRVVGRRARAPGVPSRLDQPPSGVRHRARRERVAHGTVAVRVAPRARCQSRRLEL